MLCREILLGYPIDGDWSRRLFREVGSIGWSQLAYIRVLLILGLDVIDVDFLFGEIEDNLFQRLDGLVSRKLRKKFPLVDFDADRRANGGR